MSPTSDDQTLYNFEVVASLRDSSSNDAPHSIPPVDPAKAKSAKELAKLVLSVKDRPFVEALLSNPGRLALSDFLAAAKGSSRRIAAVLSGVDILDTRAKRLQRYVRVRASYISNLSYEIENTLLSGDLDAAESELYKNLNDLLEPVTWFANRRGVGASQIRAKAEIDRLYVRFALDDLLDANPSLLDPDSSSE